MNFNNLFGILCACCTVSVSANGGNGEPCLDSSMCNVQHGFLCNSLTRKCHCFRDAWGWDTFYDPTSQKCLAYIDFSCDEVRACPADAICKERPGYLGIRIPMATRKVLEKLNAVYDPERRKCQCIDGMASLDSKTCVSILKFGEICSGSAIASSKKNLRCDPKAGLTCGTSGKCICSNTASTFYDPEMNICVTRVGGKCNLKTQCEKNSMCTSTWRDVTNHLNPHRRKVSVSPNLAANVCECLPGFTLNSNGECLASHQVECSKESPCNSDKFLTCVNGRCECQHPTSTIFAETKNSTCFLLSGSSCDPSSGPKCYQHSVCVNRKCTCNEGLYESPTDAKCEKLQSFGSTCEMKEGKRCNMFRGLACIQENCACVDDSIEWNPKSKMCEAPVGKPCGKIDLASDIGHDSDEPFYPRSVTGKTRSLAVYFVGCAEGSSCTGDTEIGYQQRHVCKAINS